MPVAVTTQPQTVREADVLVVAVKTYDTAPALDSVSHLQVGSVLSIQNGVLKDAQVAHTFGWDKTLGAATFAGKHFGFAAGLKVRVAAIAGAFFSFRFRRFLYLVSSQRVDGTQAVL